MSGDSLTDGTYARASTKRAIRLAPDDNVAVAITAIAAGDLLDIGDGQTITARQSIAFGHKIAISAIRAGQKVSKCGCPIGTATADIAIGEHVHLHNLTSDYLPTYTLQPGRKFKDLDANT